MSTVITITIGRNAPVKNSIRTAPMPAKRWASFRAEVGRILTAAEATTFVADAKSQGNWQGIAEEARTWVAEVDDFELDGRWGIRAALADAALHFEQDAIALTTGQTELVTPTLNVDPDVCRRWTHCGDCCGPCPGCGGRPGARA